MNLNAEFLKQFCSTDGSRLVICRPFSQEQWTYATDGRLLIRIPRLADVPEYGDSPKAIDKNIFGTNLISNEWQAVPTDLPPLLSEEKCRKCLGCGRHECNCGNVHDCEACEGAGVIPIRPKGVAVGCHLASEIYLHKIKGIPGIEICVSSKDDLHAIGVRFDGGGEGRLATMKKD